jgi:hypothetical protein
MLHDTADNAGVVEFADRPLLDWSAMERNNGGGAITGVVIQRYRRTRFLKSRVGICFS